MNPSTRPTIRDARDPIYVLEFHGGYGGKIELRIGYPARGESRIARLTPKQARLVAIALLTKAEKADSPKSK